MALVITEPEMLAAAAGDFHDINSVLRATNAAASGPTTAVMPAGADLVSVLTAAQFVAHAQLYQVVCAQAGAVQDQLATTLGVSAGSYAVTEAANTAACS
ncbi:PE family protein [Mycobacterium xenopi RIVM700367]|uniref:PE family protein PE32 n=1 Tax=Mycobacterium xenopi TaxID=1789 RepID=A0AAD1LZC2_MYCXE|nr:PE family protein [Mycobacterium xenopi]EID12275.1 PE family protein [Mycobacterium xenopi RIVM700367]ORX22099.1 PE family protein [Mycobacterium xenopi]BBU20662.1 PE family protein PE32 [Mycobacterium xenopi]SPX79433.1 PE family protein [Mycobacterium xenopi]